MKLVSEDLDIIKILEDDEPGKWLEGRELKYLDTANRKISVKGDAGPAVKEDPEMMLRIIRLSGEIIMDIDDKTFEAIKTNHELLKNVPRNRIRDHFSGIITSNDAEKALSYARDAGLLAYMFGDATYRSMSKRTIEDLNQLFDNISKARPESEHRWTLILYHLGKDKAVLTMNHLIMDKDFGIKVAQAIKTVDQLYFLNTKMELKKFIKKYGYDNYIFIDKIARQQKKIFERMDFKVESRHYMLEEIKNYKEPMLIEDLELNAEDLIENGYCKNEEEAQNMLDMVLDRVIIKPKLNTKEQLLKQAAHLKVNPILRKTSKIWWRK